MANNIDLTRINYGYSMKYIPTPPRKEYLLAFLHMVNVFVGRVRWKAWHILNPGQQEQKGLSIEVNVNIKIVNFLDLTLDLNSGIFKPYR